MRSVSLPVRSAPFAALLLICTLSLSAQNSTAAPTATNQATPKCRIDRTPPSEGDSDLAKTEYTKADAFFRMAVQKDAASAEANLGLVRALIGEDKVTDAQSTATAFLTAHPANALAEVATAEAEFRAAHFVEAREHLIKAIKIDACEGRSLDDIAQLYDIYAFYATETRLLASAHALRPNDELILRDWISTLPRKQRQIELAKYLESTTALSEKDRKGLTNEEDHLKARRPGECSVTAKPPAGSQTVKVPFLPVTSDSAAYKTYGLDATFDGKRRRMQIDTGASGITLSPAAAKRLGLTPEYRTSTGGVGDEGDVGSYLTHVAKIQIGDIELANCMVEVLEKSKHNLDVDGLIGMDVFRHWLVTLDYPNAKLLLDPLPPLPDAQGAAATQNAIADTEDETPHDAIVPPTETEWLHVVRVAHELLLPANLNGGPLHYMMMDTGADLTNLSLNFAKEGGKLHIADEVEFSGVSGKVKKSYALDRARLRFGNAILPPESFYAFDITSVSHNAGTEISGFVGLETLSRLTITIDYRDNLMQLKYNPGKDLDRF